MVADVGAYRHFVPWCQKSNIVVAASSAPRGGSGIPLGRSGHGHGGGGYRPSSTAGSCGTAAAGPAAGTVAREAGGGPSSYPLHLEAELEVGFQMLVERCGEG